MKKLKATLLTLTAIAGLLLAGAESPYIIINFCGGGLFFASAKIAERTFKVAA